MAQIPHKTKRGCDILVTGSGGRLGRLLRAAARRDGTGGMQVLFQSRGPGADIRWAPGDALSALPACGTLIALWGKTGGDDAALSDNVTLVQRSIAAARACGAKRLIHISSAAVYGPGAALREDAPLAPANAYGQAKRDMEAAVAALPKGSQNAPAQCCLRLANVVGADSLAPGLAGSGPIRMTRFADGGGPIRSYMGASDLLKLFLGLHALDPSDVPHVLNVACPTPFRMEELARAAGRSLDWHPAPAGSVHEVTLDAGALGRLLPSLAQLDSAAAQIEDWQDLERRT